jgi:N-methylhydantoinase B
VDDVDGKAELLPGITRTSLVAGDVVFWSNNGGGGYGDPLDREVDVIAEDHRLGYISREQAARVYGFAQEKGGAVDPTATAANRERIRKERIARAAPPPSQPVSEPASERVALVAGAQVTDRLSVADDGGRLVYQCRCGLMFGDARRGYRGFLPRFDAPCTDAGPRCMNLIANPPVVLRHYVCPGCGALVDVDVAEARA